MSSKRNSSELERALARPDACTMIEQLDRYADHFDDKHWPDVYAEDFGEILTCHFDDPEKALTYVVLGAARTDDADFLALLACGPLENVLTDPSQELLDRIVAEARKSARFRWLLSHPFKIALAERAWDAIEKFRITGPHEEPPHNTLPPR